MEGRRLLSAIAVILLCYQKESVAQPIPYKEEYFDQYLDHFNLVSFGDKTFKQRYLVQDHWWAEGSGPIFFYTGNEGDITDFWKATGFVFDIAEQFGAFVVFAEHRYYGKSLPFGQQSFDPNNVGLLSVEQAMADYAVLISALKTSMNATNCPVIAFGGSYGGMLSAYMRFKYPSIITGSIAASAPIYLLTSDIDRTFFFNAVTAHFAAATPNCEPRVRQAFIDLMNIAAKGPPGLQELTTIFKTCNPLKNSSDIHHLLGWIRNSFANLAMFNYPYPATFFSKLPANPVKFACQYMEDAKDFVQGLAKAAGLFYNGTYGTLKCYDTYAEFVECADPTGCGTGPNSAAWDFQACTEIQLTAGSNNKTDMFPDLPFTPDLRKAYCKDKWSVIPRDSWGNVQFWGRNIASATNIVFSNGDLDPWKEGGVLKSPNPDVELVIIAGGAHHLDLRAKNPKDPISVIDAREKEKAAIRKWINS